MARFPRIHSKDRPVDRKVKDSRDPTYHVGEAIVHPGIYRVLHRGHRDSHTVVLLSGQHFPRCARCGQDVQFQLVEATPHIKNDSDFRVHLYEIPHPPPAGSAKKHKKAS